MIVVSHSWSCRSSGRQVWHTANFRISLIGEYLFDNARNARWQRELCLFAPLQTEIRFFVHIQRRFVVVVVDAITVFDRNHRELGPS